MKQSRRFHSHRSGHPSTHQTGGQNASPAATRKHTDKKHTESPAQTHHFSRSSHPVDDTYISTSAVAPKSPAEFEAYLVRQMRRLIHARQDQERALRQIRVLNEQLARNDSSPQLQEQYHQAVLLWQTHRRNGINTRQKLLFALSEKLMIV